MKSSSAIDSFKFIIFCIFLIIVYFVIQGHYTYFIKNSEKINAIVTDSYSYEKEYTIFSSRRLRDFSISKYAYILTYEYNGIIYKDVELKEISKDTEKGSEIQILVLKNNPQKIQSLEELNADKELSNSIFFLGLIFFILMMIYIKLSSIDIFFYF
jgi:hypothetical protein